MEIVTKAKGRLLRNKYVKKLSGELKLKRFYNNTQKNKDKSESILFWSTGGMIIQTNLEGVIACALKLRGHNVHMVLCDGVYKACAKRVDMPEVPVKEWGKYCRSCIRENSKLLDKLGISYSYISDLVSEDKIKYLKEEVSKITYKNYKNLSLNGIQLGNHLDSAMMRHTRGGSFEGLEELLKEYAFTILINAEASEEALKKFNPSKVYMSHGIYADWGPALSVSLEKNIPTVSYISCYLTAHFFFGTVRNHKETFLTISDKSWEKQKNEELTGIQKERLRNFLERRYMKNITHDMKGFLKVYKGNRDYFLEKYQLNKDKPIWGIMTHINWDAMSDYFPMIHKSFDDWLYHTVKEIYNIKDVQWLIKIHPSELNDNPETGCQKFIENNFPDLPGHIKMIKMDDDISPLDFYHLLDGAVTVMGTGGLELSLQGKPVILAGEAHYSNKGFTFDAKNEHHYKQLLKEAANTKTLDEDKKILAWKYAYIYFIKKQISLLPTIKEDLHIDFKLLNYLISGRNKYMDFLCDRIIDGEDFILPDELVDIDYLTEHEQIRNFV